VFAYSWSLLTEVERQALAGLSVFRGSVDRTAAEAVAGVTPATLMTLVDKSLLQRVEVGRYRLHELLRQFAFERLLEVGETTTLRDRHLAHFLALAEQTAPKRRDPRQRELLERLDRDLDNVRAALGWAREQGETERCLRLTVTLHRFWLVRGYRREAWRWLEEGLERAQDLSPEVWAQALWSMGTLALEFGEHERATSLLGEAAARFEALDDQAGLTWTLTRQGIAAFRQGNYDAATAHLEAGLRLAEKLGDQQERALAQFNLGVIEERLGNTPAARDRLEPALALERTRGDPHTIVMMLAGLASVSLNEGNLEEAETHLHELLALARDLASQTDTAYALGNLGDVATQQGRYDQAAAYLRESVLLARDLGDTYLLVSNLGEHAKLAAAQGQAERAVQLGEAETRLRDERGMVFAIGELTRREQVLTRAREQLDEHDFRRAWEGGHAMELEDAVRYALSGGALERSSRASDMSASKPRQSLRPH
jgi:tetratricopeptide (TPR) repeat protein